MKMSKRIIGISLLMSLVILLAGAIIVSAAPPPLEQPDNLSNQELTIILKNIASVIAGLVGGISIIVIVIAGFLWVLAGGDEDKVKTARQWVIGAVLGLVIALAAYAIVNLVLTKVFLS